MSTGKDERMFLTTGSVAGAQLVITDRVGGVSSGRYDSLNLGDHVGDDHDAVGQNRHRVAAALDPSAGPLALMRQVHGAVVAVIDGPGDAGQPRPVQAPEADAMVSTARGLALAVLVADCVPVLFASTEPEVIAVAHAGRRGVQEGVVAATVAAMQRAGARPASIQTRVGPAICGRCYEVSPQVQAEVVRTVPEARSTTRAGTPGLDIRAGVLAQLEACGVGSVEMDQHCTAEHGALYSYRRDGVTGRFAGIVWLPQGTDAADA
jgi:hypothetical protein